MSVPVLCSPERDRVDHRADGKDGGVTTAHEPGTDAAPAGARFPEQLMYEAARLYYLQDATQADIAERLSTSRATVSRLLSEARRTGVVRIEVVPPRQADDEALAERCASTLGLERVWLVPSAEEPLVGPALAPRLSEALLAAELRPGDVLLVASGRTVYEAARSALPALPGVVVAPTVGGQEEPEAWYQSNEITREVAARVGGRPAFLYAPALPSPDLHRILLDEPAIRRVLELWSSARCAVVGVGAPPLTRASISASVPTDAVSLREAVGDICLRFFDRDGRPVAFPGSDRMISTSLELLRSLPTTIAVAAGSAKVPALLAAARAGYVNQLVTDRATANELLVRSTSGS